MSSFVGKFNIAIVLIVLGAIAADGSGRAPTSVLNRDRQGPDYALNLTIPQGRAGAVETRAAFAIPARAGWNATASTVADAVTSGKHSDSALNATDSGGIPRSSSSDSSLLANLTGFPAPFAAQSGAASQTERMNGIVSACSQAGSTADAQIDAAITTLGENGGVVDLACYGGSVQSLAGTIHVPANVWIRGNGRITKFQPASGSFTPLFSIDTNTSRVSGVWVDMANLAPDSFNGCVYGLSGNYQPLKNATSDPMQTTIEDFAVTAWNQSTGAAICMTATGLDNSIDGVSVRHGYISGTQNAFNLQESGPGWINGNEISDVYIKQGAEAGECGILMHAIGTTPGGIDLNTFSQMSHEDITGIGDVYGVCVMGGGFIQGNTWEGMMADSPVPVHYDCSPSCGDTTYYQGNSFSGALNGLWETGSAAYDNHFGLWNREYSFGGPLTVNSINIMKAGGLQYQGSLVFGPNVGGSISIYPMAPGGEVVDEEPGGGYAPHDSDSYRVHRNVVIPSVITGFQGSGTAVSIANGPFTPGNLRMTDGGGSDADSGLSRNSIPTASSTVPMVNGIACIKAAGPPIVIGYCITAPAASSTPLYRNGLNGTPLICVCE